MEESKLQRTKTRKENDSVYAQMMLTYIAEKYDRTFEIIDTIFPKDGFNAGHLQNVLLVKETQSGVVTHIYATLAEPYIYSDTYVSDLASWENRHLVDCSAIDALGKAKLYLYLRNEDVNAPDVSKENVSRATLVVNINQKPDTQTLQALYGVYKNLQALDYEYVFLVAGFTEEHKSMENYTQFYRVYGKKTWNDYDGTVYATLMAKDAGLTFEEFQKLCEYN